MPVLYGQVTFVWPSHIVWPSHMAKSHSSHVQLLQAADRVERGLTATDEDKASIDKMAKALEATNPNPKSLSAKEINGRWKLVYTTSEGILGTKRPPFLRPSGPIYQIIGTYFQPQRKA